MKKSKPMMLILGASAKIAELIEVTEATLEKL